MPTDPPGRAGRNVTRSHVNWRALADELAEGHRVRSGEHDVCLYVNRREARGILAALRYASVSEPKASQFAATAWGDRITDEQLDEPLARAEKSQTVLLRIDQFRDLVRQARSAAACEAERLELEHLGDPEKKTGIYAPTTSAGPARVDQTELGPLGNCQSACLSMLLGVPLAEIPNFAAIAQGDGNVYFHRQNEWLNARGWGLLTIVGHQALPWPPKHGWYIAGGVSPRGNRHAVVFKDGALWHDPHPEHGGISGVDDVDILYPLRPFAGSEKPATKSDIRCPICGWVCEEADREES